MGFTCDVGQLAIDRVEVVAQYELGTDKLADFFQFASDYCLAHDHNTLVGICYFCGDDDSMVAYEKATRRMCAEYLLEE